MTALPEKLMWLLATRRYSMFMPGSRDDLLLEYPELQDIPSMNALRGKPKELLFVWYYACKASPAMELTSHGERVEFATNAVYRGKPPLEVVQRYKDKRWSPEIARAIPDMQAFELGVRVKNRLILEKMQNDILFIIGSKDAMHIKNTEEQKQYLDLCVQAQKFIATSTKQAEGGFSVKEIAPEDESAGAVRERVQILTTDK